MSDPKCKSSMGEAFQTVHIWKSPCWYKGSMKAEVLFTMTDLCTDLAFEISHTGLPMICPNTIA